MRRAWIARTLLMLAATLALPALADDVGRPARDEHGFLVHGVECPHQSGPPQVRVLLPEPLDPKRCYPVVYVLPVEAGTEHRYGDGLIEVKNRDLANKHSAIFVAPTFSHLPWYADHPTDPAIRQEAYLLEVVLPLVEKTCPALAEPRGRLLLGFSKSGWGAWALLLRHPDVFGRAAAWDTPMMMDRPGQFGSGPVFGSRDNFEKYHLARLLREQAGMLRGDKRLILLGHSSFAHDHNRMHALLDELRIPHEYRGGPMRQHDWHSGWVSEAVDLLLALAKMQ